MSVVASLLYSLRFLVRSRAALDLEIVALRRQLVVTSRSRRPRLRLTALDRALWSGLAHQWSGWRSALHVVQPTTVLAWYRRGSRLFWTWKSRHRTGSPGMPPGVRAQIRELYIESALGFVCIHGELQLMNANLFVVPTVTFRLVSVLVILAHDRRRLAHLALTEHPTARQYWRTFSCRAVAAR